jgi:hypothetical protein
MIDANRQLDPSFDAHSHCDAAESRRLPVVRPSLADEAPASCKPATGPKQNQPSDLERLVS